MKIFLVLENIFWLKIACILLFVLALWGFVIIPLADKPQDKNNIESSIDYDFVKK